MKILISESQLRKLVEAEQSCEQVVTYDMLNRAKNWWIDHLTNNPAILSKIMMEMYGKDKMAKMDKSALTNLIDSTAKNIQDAINKIKSVNKLKYINEKSNRAATYSDFEPTIITVNCYQAKNFGAEELYGFLVHELQHSIHGYIGSYSVIGLSSEKNNWLYRDIPKSTESESSWYEKAKNYVLNLFNTEKGKTGIRGDEYFTKQYLKNIYDKLDYKNYACDPDEVQSRVNQIRAILKLKANQNITIDMLRDPKIYDQFYFNLICWGGRTDNVSLQDYLNNLNQLAVNKKPDITNQV